MIDRAPKPAPFPVGTRLRYQGSLKMSTAEGVPILAPGIEASVIEIRPGYRGTGRLIDLDDGGEPIRDETSDGYSVVEPVPGWRRIASADDWRPIAPAPPTNQHP